MHIFAIRFWRIESCRSRVKDKESFFTHQVLVIFYRNNLLLKPNTRPNWSDIWRWIWRKRKKLTTFRKLFSDKVEAKLKAPNAELLGWTRSSSSTSTSFIRYHEQDQAGLWSCGLLKNCISAGPAFESSYSAGNGAASERIEIDRKSLRTRRDQLLAERGWESFLSSGWVDELPDKRKTRSRFGEDVWRSWATRSTSLAFKSPSMLCASQQWPNSAAHLISLSEFPDSKRGR